MLASTHTHSSLRCNFYAYCIFSFVNTVVYCVPAGWLWGDHGFLKKLGAVDVAGSGGVHLVGGASGTVLYVQMYLQAQRAGQCTRWWIHSHASSVEAFTAAMVIGPRLGRWDIVGDPPMGSPSNAVIGLFMLWWGWLAFNAGSTFGNREL